MSISDFDGMDNEVLETGLVNTSRVIKDNEKKALEAFLYGSGDMTEEAKSIVRTILEKLNIGLGISVVNQISRKTVLESFIIEAEKVIYNKEKIASMDDETLIKTLQSANKSLLEINDFHRKFIAHNKELLQRDVAVEGNKANELYNKLMALSPDKLDKITSVVEEVISSSFGDAEVLE